MLHCVTILQKFCPLKIAQSLCCHRSQDNAVETFLIGRKYRFLSRRVGVETNKDRR